MLVKKHYIVKPIYKYRRCFKNVYIQTCTAHLYNHITALVLYMISHHLTGQTLQSMLVIIYIHRWCFTGQAEMDGLVPHLDSSVRRNREADKQKTQKRWQNHTAEAWKLIGLVCGCDWFDGHVGSCHSNKEPRARMSGKFEMFQNIVAGACGQC